MSTTRVPTPTSILNLGHAQGDMTPPVGIYHRMWGAALHDRASGVHKPLLADVLIMESAESTDRFVRIQIDSVMLDNNQTNAVVGDIPSIAVVDPARVLFTHSHSHSAGLFLPDRVPLPGGELIEVFLDSLRQTLEELTRKAFEDLSPAVVSYAYGRCNMAASMSKSRFPTAAISAKPLRN